MTDQERMRASQAVMDLLETTTATGVDKTRIDDALKILKRIVENLAEDIAHKTGRVI